MIKSVLKRALVFSLTLALIISILPGTVITSFAAVSGSLDDNRIGLSDDGNGTWTAQGTEINGVMTASCGKTGTSTLTLTNNSEGKVHLSFQYSITSNSQSVTIDGATKTGEGTFEKELAASGSAIIKLNAKGGSYTDGETSISITNISLIALDAKANITFTQPMNGTVTVDKVPLDATKVFSDKTAAEGYSVEAEPSDGYRFFGWIVDGKLFSRELSTTLKFDKDTTVEAKFIGTNEPVFDVGGQFYYDYGSAIEAAQAGDAKTVSLLVDWTAENGFTVPTGITFLIPCMENDAGYTNGFSPDGTTAKGTTGPNGTLYCTLTVPEDAVVSVSGTMLVNAVTGRNIAGHYDQDVNGGYGEVQLNGRIEVNEGGLLDVNGYVRGSGSIDVASGGKVYDLYVVINWRGGSAASGAVMAGHVYPMNEFKMHNIEVQILLQHDSTLSGTVKMFADGGYQRTRFPQVDNSNGLFRFTSGSVSKTYIDGREKLVFDGDGGLYSSSITVPAAGALSTRDYIYPFDGDMDFSFSGNWTFNERIKFMPGATVTLENGASLTVPEKTASASNTDNLIVFYDNTFQDATISGTRYPSDRADAVLIMKGGSTLTALGAFGGKIAIDRNATETSPATVTASGAVSVTTQEMMTASFMSGTTQDITFTANINGYQLETGKTYRCYYENGKLIIELEGTGDSRENDYNGQNIPWDSADGKSVEYYVDNAWTSAAPKNVGEYRVREVVEGGTDDYKLVRSLGTLTIKPLVAEFELDGESTFPYDGQAHTVTAKVTNKVGDDNVTVTLSGDTGTDAQTYTATVTGLDGTASKNYTIGDNKDLSWEITQAPLTLTWDGQTTFTYNGSEHSVSAVLEGQQGEDELTVSLSDDKHTDVGNYEAKAEITGDKIGNYEMPTNLTQEWSITQADAPEIVFPTVSGPITYDPDGKLESVELSFTSNEYGDFAWTDGSIKPTVDVTSYEVTFTASEKTKQNYKEIAQTTAMVTVAVQKGEQAAPAGVTAHNEQTIPGNDGYITGVDTSMEWKKQTGGEDDWQTVEGTEITGLAAGGYDVRFKANENQNAGTPVTVTVNKYDPTAERQPEASIYYKAEQLTGLEPNGDYKINEAPVKADGDGKIRIDETWIGARISIVKKGDGVKTNDSDALELAVPARPAAPAGLTGGYTSKPGDADGRVTGLTDGVTYEYKAGSRWEPLTGETELAAGSYQVRLSATNEAFYSEETEITVQDPAYAATPNVTIDYENEKLTGFGEGSYTVNDEAVTVGEDSAVAIRTEWFGKPINIVLKGSGPAVIDSPPQSVNVPARPAAPELQGKAPTSSAGTDGSVTGLDSGKLYEYRTDGGEWTTVEAGRESIDGLAAGEYEVRLKATESSFAGDSAAVTVADYVAPPAPSNPGSGGTGAPDESKTETVTNPDGSTTTTTTKPDGTSVETTTTPEGVVGTTGKDASGNVTNAEVTVPQGGSEGVVKAPVEVPSAGSTKEAPEVNVHVQGEGSVKMEVPVTHVGPGTVAVVVHPDGTEEVVRDCVISEDGVVLNVEGDVTLKIVENSAEFNDIEGVESWAGDAIEFTSARELFSGTGGNNFQPDGDMTRGALVTLLHRLSYEPDAPATKFDDVEDAGLYTDAIAWADANSIVTGNGNGLFMPHDNITREQLVMLIYNYAKFRGAVMETAGNINAFADADKVHDYAREAMAWAIGAGIVSGQGDNTLNPAGITTRAQTAVILMNLCNYMAKY